MMTLKEGMKVRFADPHWGNDIATIVQCRGHVLLEDADGNNFIREIDEILEEVEV
jgi:hypothetical protein